MSAESLPLRGGESVITKPAPVSDIQLTFCPSSPEVYSYTAGKCAVLGNTRRETTLLWYIYTNITERFVFRLPFNRRTFDTLTHVWYVVGGVIIQLNQTCSILRASQWQRPDLCAFLWVFLWVLLYAPFEKWHWLPPCLEIGFQHRISKSNIEKYRNTDGKKKTNSNIEYRECFFHWSYSIETLILPINATTACNSTKMYNG